MATETARRVVRSVMVLVVAGSLASCIDEVTPPERQGVAAQTNAMRIILDDKPVMTVYEDGKITLGPIIYPRRSATLDDELPIRVELLDRQGNVIPNVDPNEARINIGGTSSTANFVRTDAFSGILRSTNNNIPATTDLQVGLYDMKQHRTAIGPYVVRVTARVP